MTRGVALGLVFVLWSAALWSCGTTGNEPLAARAESGQYDLAGSRRCYNAESLVVMTDARSCEARGLLDEPPSPTVERRVCADSAGQTIEVSADQSCERMGYSETSGAVVTVEQSRGSPEGGGGVGGSGGPVQVRGYTRANGTYVAPYSRSAPGSGGRRR